MILAWLQRYALYLSLAVATVGWGAAGVQTVRLAWAQAANEKSAGEAATRVAEATQAAREKEFQWAVILKETADVKESQLRTVAGERDAALASLRNRPRNRLPSAATPACNGASPAAIDAEDAEVAVGFANEFDRLRVVYADCKSKLEAIGK